MDMVHHGHRAQAEELFELNMRVFGMIEVRERIQNTLDMLTNLQPEADILDSSKN